MQSLWHACMGIVSICIIIIVAIDKDIETKPNDVYGLIDGELYGIYIVTVILKYFIDPRLIPTCGGIA